MMEVSLIFLWYTLLGRLPMLLVHIVLLVYIYVYEEFRVLFRLLLLIIFFTRYMRSIQ